MKWKPWSIGEQHYRSRHLDCSVAHRPPMLISALGPQRAGELPAWWDERCAACGYTQRHEPDYSALAEFFPSR